MHTIMITNRGSVKDLPPMERPREKLRHLGAAALSDLELLAVILGSGTVKVPVLGVCGQLMDALDGDLEKLMELDADALCRVTGIGKVRALTFLAAVALAERLQALHAAKAVERLDDRSMTALLRPFFETAEEQKFLLILLTGDHRLLATAELSVQGEGFPEISKVVSLAAEAGTNRFLVAWKGLNPPPVQGLTETEMAYFRELSAAGAMLNIGFDGLVIFTGNECYKFAANTGGGGTEICRQ